ncbi:MAG TPA: hypothetical protein VMG34_07635 [Bacteroidota bacterium]|nr:hypothetical protein [Bacteroidota bacterium]
MKKEFASGLSLLCLALLTLAAAARGGIGEWKNYTYMNNVVSIAATRNVVWAGTTGGVLRFAVSDSTFQKFTNSEGLTSNGITAVGIDRQGSVWIGDQSGSIDIYSPSSNTWRYLDDIAVSPPPQKGVNGFTMHGDTVYIETQFGVCVFTLSKFEFKDTYGGFGSLSHPNVTSMALLNGQLFVGTSGGIAVSKPGAINLSAPESWDSFTAPASVTGVAVYRGSVYAASASGAYVYGGGVWTSVAGASQPLTALVSTDSALYLAGLNGFLVVSPSGSVSAFGGTTPATIACAAADSTGRLFAGFQDGGIGLLGNVPGAWSRFVTNGPVSNFFTCVAVDDNGTVWATSAGAGGKTGNGFYSYDGRSWRNYNVATTPQLPEDVYFSVSIGPNNSKWVGTWGKGLTLIDGNGNFVRNFDDTNPGFVGAGPSAYVVIGATATDASGNVWVPNYLSENGYVLWEMKPDSTWVQVRAAQSNSYANVIGVTVDRNGTKWCSNALPGFIPSGALMYYNEAGGIQGLDVDGWGQVTLSTGLSSNTVTSVVEDLNGSMWVGTDVGVTIINDPAYPLSQNTIIYLGAVRDQFINTIVVDPSNNKWIGTQTGVDLVSADGSTLLAQYTSSNTNGKLVDDDVLSIALDEKRGIAYFGTTKGLSSLEIPPIATVEQMTSLQVGPNPFLLPSSTSLSIKGLADNTTIKILTASGSLVKQFAAQGAGRAFWDGTDGNGKTVGSGVYFVVAYSNNGSQVATAKVAVLRR